jgi:hypothetical protein
MIADERHRRLQELAQDYGFSIRKRVAPSLTQKGRIYYIVDTRNEVDCFGDFATLEQTAAYLKFLIGIRREKECRAAALGGNAMTYRQAMEAVAH